MKLKRFFIFGLLVLVGLLMVACGNETESDDIKSDDETKEDGNETDKQEDKKEDGEEQKKEEEQVEINFDSNETDVEVIKGTAKTEYKNVFDEAVKNLTEEQKAVLEVKYQEILTKIDEVNGTAEAVKTELNTYYKELNETVTLLNKAVETFEAQKEQALAELKVIYDSIAAVANPTTLEYVKSLYDQYVEEIKNLAESEKAHLSEIGKAFAEAGKEYVKTIADEAITAAITYAREELKKLADNAIARIEKESLRTKVTELYNTLDLKIAGIVDSGKATELIEGYLKEFSVKLVELYKEEAALTVEEYKKLAVERLDRIYNEYLEKVTDETVKKALKDFYDQTVASINSCKTDEEVKAIYDNIEKTVKDYVSTDLIATLVNGYKDTIKNLVKTQIDKIPYEEIKTSANQLVETEIAKLDNVTDLEDLKTKAADMIKNLPTDITNLVKEHGEKLLAEAKEIAKKYINDALAVAIAKVDDEAVKTQLTTAKDTALAELDKIKDTESFETAINNIKTKFGEEVTKALGALITKYVDLAKAEADKVYALVNAKLSEASQTAFKTIYDNYAKALSEINNVETAAKEAEEATKKFLSDSKTYITEALTALKAEYVQKAEDKYNEYAKDIDIEEYKTKFDGYLATAKAAINNLTEIETFVEDAAKAISDLAASAANELTNYLVAKAAILKTEALEKGKKLYDEVYLKEEYTSKSMAGKLVAKAAIEAAYATYNTAINNLTPAVGAKTVCDTAYDTLVSAFNKALGITTETN